MKRPIATRIRTNLGGMAETFKRFLETPTNQTNAENYSEIARIAFASRNNGSELVVLSSGQSCDSCRFNRECPAYQAKEELSDLVTSFGEGAVNASPAQIAAARDAGLSKDTLTTNLPDESVITVQRVLDGCGMQTWAHEEIPRIFEQPHGIDASRFVSGAITRVREAA